MTRSCTHMCVSHTLDTSFACSRPSILCMHKNIATCRNRFTGREGETHEKNSKDVTVQYRKMPGEMGLTTNLVVSHTCYTRWGVCMESAYVTAI